MCFPYGSVQEPAAHPQPARVRNDKQPRDLGQPFPRLSAERGPVRQASRLTYLVERHMAA